MQDLENVLVEMGYQLLDRGNEFRTSAVYRGGDNNTSVCISKEDGRWYDFKERIGGRFDELVKLTLKTDAAEVDRILANKNISAPISTANLFVSLIYLNKYSNTPSSPYFV